MKRSKSKGSTWDLSLKAPEKPISKEEIMRAQLESDDIVYDRSFIPQYIMGHKEFKSVDLKSAMFKSFTSQRVTQFALEDAESGMPDWPEIMNGALLKMCLYVRSLDAFQAYSNSQLISFLKIMTLQTFNKGDTIFREGELSTGFFIVLDGEVAALAPGTSTKILRVLTPGQTFGDSAASAESTRLFSAAALTDNTVVGFFSRSGFAIRNREAIETEIQAVTNFLVQSVEGLHPSLVSTRLVAQMCRASTIRRVQLGEVVFDDTKRGVGVVFLIEGTFKVFCKAEVTDTIGMPTQTDGVERVLVTKLVTADEGEGKPGDHFGHHSLFNEGDEGLLVAATGPGLIMFVPGMIFKKYLNDKSINAFLVAGGHVPTGRAVVRKVRREQTWNKLRTEMVTTALVNSTRAVPQKVKETKARQFEDNIINRMAPDPSKFDLKPEDQVLSVDIVLTHYDHIKRKEQQRQAELAAVAQAKKNENLSMRRATLSFHPGGSPPETPTRQQAAMHLTGTSASSAAGPNSSRRKMEKQTSVASLPSIKNRLRL